VSVIVISIVASLFLEHTVHVNGRCGGYSGQIFYAMCLELRVHRLS